MYIQVMGFQFHRPRRAFCLSPILGVVGGRGLLASSEFLLSICEYGLNGDEQGSPSVIMHSDPTLPDRTAFLGGRDAILLDRLVAVLESLRSLGASKVGLCGVTIQRLLMCFRSISRACGRKG
jgi:aspartate racemase